METLEEAVRRLVKDGYGSIPKFAEKIDVPPTTVYNALDRGLANTRTELTDRIYRELNIDWDTAKLGNDYRGLRLKGDVRGSFVDVPLYGSIAAGMPLEMIEVEDTHAIPLEVQRNFPDAFLLRVVGESMNRILPNGSYALVDPCEEVERDGQPYAVCVNGFDATIKRVKKLHNGFELVPDSTDPTFTSKVYDYGIEGTETITVIGRVVWYCIPYEWRF